MLRRVLSNPVAAVFVGALVGLFLLWLISWTFGLTYEVCGKPEPGGYQNCTSQNFVLFLIWKTVDTLKAGSELITAIATVLLFVVTYLLVDLGREQSKTSRAQLRAYVKMAHNQPGLMWNTRGADVGMFIRNAGATPSRVTDALVNLRVVQPKESLPATPTYELIDRQPTRAFPLTGDEIHFSQLFTYTLDAFDALPAGARLCVVGYVDYIDAFNVRYRGGYARVYLRHASGNNLGFVPDAGWNYDRPRITGEGTDWD